VSWNLPLPTAPTDPETPEEPENPPPAPPAPPLPSDQITLGPPSASVSWDGPQVPTTTADAVFGRAKRQFDYDPAPTNLPVGDPENPEDPEDGGPIVIPTLTVLQPSDNIGISPPTATIIWGKRQFENGPDSGDEEPEDPEDGGPSAIPDGPPQNPPDQITLNPPTATISWGKRQFENGPQPTDVPEDPENPDDPGDGGPITITGNPLQTPHDTVTIAPPTATITWGKRQFEYDPEPTDIPENPENPDDPGDSDPITIPGNPPQNPPDIVTIAPPTATITWGKRQFEYDPEPTDMPENTEDPEDGGPIVIPTNQPANPPGSIGMNPPSATISWGKSQEDEDPTITAIPPNQPTPSDQITNAPPTASITWGKRQFEYNPEPTDLPEDPEDPADGGPNVISTNVPQNPPDSIGINPPVATISWGKRDVDLEATNSWGIVWPTFFPKPTIPGYISWNKAPAPVPTAAIAEPLNAEAAYVTCASTNTVTSLHPCPTYSCGGACSLTPGTVTAPAPPPVHNTECPLTATATNVCASCVCHTTLIPSTRPNSTITAPPSPPSSFPTTSCLTITSTIVPPCIPPMCPHPEHIACKKFVPAVREIEKRFVTMTTSVDEVEKCTIPVPTKTLFKGCPTYTCVPKGDC
jgi:hypothetical protein